GAYAHNNVGNNHRIKSSRSNRACQRDGSRTGSAVVEDCALVVAVNLAVLPVIEAAVGVPGPVAAAIPNQGAVGDHDGPPYLDGAEIPLQAGTRNRWRHQWEDTRGINEIGIAAAVVVYEHREALPGTEGAVQIGHFDDAADVIPFIGIDGVIGMAGL